MLHAFHFVGGGLLAERALAHHIGAQGGVADVATVVDAFRQTVQHVEIFAKGFPTPFDAGFHRVARQVFGALEIAEHEVGVLRRTGREGETAVAHDDGGDAVVAGAGAERVPEDLRVHVRVAIDEARRHHLPTGIDAALGALIDAANLDYLTVLDADIGRETRTARTVYHIAVFDHQVVHRHYPCEEFIGD